MLLAAINRVSSGVVQEQEALGVGLNWGLERKQTSPIASCSKQTCRYFAVAPGRMK